MTDKLKKLLARCKCGVYLTVNEHRDVYDTAAEELEKAGCMECPPEIAPEVRAEMIRTNTIVQLQFYPDTPIGSYEIWHYDLDTALDMALECLRETAVGGFGDKAPQDGRPLKDGESFQFFAAD